MCGIVGMFGNLWHKHEKAFKQMLILDSVRGIDSTGIAVTDQPGGVKIAKQLGNPYELMDHPSFNKAFYGKNRSFIGHNRFKTSGEITRRNAHPFDFETLVGVHNGTLTNKWELDDAVDFKVDSENLYHHINKNGVRAAFNVAQGAWALVWWDKVNETVNLLRNDQRPLFIGVAKDSDVVMYASESWMIEVAAARNEIVLKDVNILPVDTLFSYHVDKLGNISKPVCTPMEARKREAYTMYNQSPFVGNVKPSNVSVTPTGKVVVFSPKKAEDTSLKKSSSPRGVIPVAKESLLSGELSLEVLGSNIDHHGSEYLTCFYDKMPTTEIRLYVKKTDKIDRLLGETILGKCPNYILENGKGYYKVLYSTFRLKNPKRDAFKNYKGDEVTKQEWEKEHGECLWCGDPVFAEDNYKFTSTGCTLCETCAKDSEVKKYVN